MPHLRLALAAGGLLLAVPALASCGFDYPTERVNTVGAGVTERGGDVDVAGTMIVSAQPDSGTLIGGLSNTTEEPITLASVTGGDEGGVEADEFEPIEIPGRGHVNLATLEEGLTVSGSFEAGDFVTVSFDFDNDQSTTLEIPVMKACYEYEGLDTSGEGEASEDPLYSCEAPEAPAEH